MSTTTNAAGGATLDPPFGVRSGRRPVRSTVLLFGYGFLVLFSYYLLKPVRDALILSENGAEARSYLGRLRPLCSSSSCQCTAPSIVLTEGGP